MAERARESLREVFQAVKELKQLLGRHPGLLLPTRETQLFLWIGGTYCFLLITVACA